MLRRNGNIQHFNAGVIQQFLVVFADAGNGVASRHEGRVIAAAGCDGDWIEAGAPVAYKMAIVDDKPASENPDAEVFPLRCRRKIAQLMVLHRILGTRQYRRFGN